MVCVCLCLRRCVHIYVNACRHKCGRIGSDETLTKMYVEQGCLKERDIESLGDWRRDSQSMEPVGVLNASLSWCMCVRVHVHTAVDDIQCRTGNRELA